MLNSPFIKDLKLLDDFVWLVHMSRCETGLEKYLQSN